MADAVKQVVEGVKEIAIGKKVDKKEKKKKGNDSASSGSSKEISPEPDFIKHRLELYHRLKKTYDEEVAAKPRAPISITMADGSIKAGTAWETTPAQIAEGISKSLLKRTVIAKLNKEQLWDLKRPLEADCSLELLSFDDAEGKQVFWHSSAHMLGEASERRFGCDLCFGPPTERGFFYDMRLPESGAVQHSDWSTIEERVGKIVKAKQAFERLELSKEDLLEMFKDNPYKHYYINTKIPDGTRSTVYRDGDFIDLCLGPHVPDTGRIESFAIERNSAAYWLGDPKNDSLQRISGISFPDKKLMAAHKKWVEEAAMRNHRKIGADQELFFFNEMSPGSTMWLPHGARLYNNLVNFIKEEYQKRGYFEVMSPNMFNSKLWKQSGHWDHYKDDMFTFEVEKEQFALKPMNCPGHCIMFGHRTRSHKELPLRLADFGVLHRNEASGALSGLTRVRRFQQDDGHTFCRDDQITAEIEGLFDMISTVYNTFGFTFKMKLSTRPEKFMGEIETWDMAEDQLKTALDNFGQPWEYNYGDGAFYGPKIDVTISDCLDRDWQCATIQLDFQGPLNFGLEYMAAEGAVKEAKPEKAEPKKVPVDASAAPSSAPASVPNAAKIDPADPSAATAAPSAPAEAATNSGEKEKAPVRVIKPLTSGCKRPIIIHRAVIGSVERFSGVLMEHYAGKWPFWINPRQIMVIPVGVGYNDYANEVRDIFHEQGMFVDVDTSGNTLKDKIRTAQLERYNFTFGKFHTAFVKLNYINISIVVGDVEKTKREVNIRNRDDTSSQDRGKPVPVQEAIDKLVALRNSRKEGNPFAVSTEERKAELLKQVEKAKKELEAREKALADLE